MVYADGSDQTDIIGAGDDCSGSNDVCGDSILQYVVDDDGNTNHNHIRVNTGIVAASDSTEDWAEKGFRLFEEGRHNESLQCYERALEVDANSSINWNGRGLNLLCLGKYSEALECYESAIEKDPNSFMSWRGKATSLEGLGKHTEALDCYKKALEIHGQYNVVFHGKVNHR